jgi:hypothetical protein
MRESLALVLQSRAGTVPMSTASTRFLSPIVDLD